MHFTGRTWRPPYESASFIIQATSGCTYNKCNFAVSIKMSHLRWRQWKNLKQIWLN